MVLLSTAVFFHGTNSGAKAVVPPNTVCVMATIAFSPVWVRDVCCVPE